MTIRSILIPFALALGLMSAGCAQFLKVPVNYNAPKQFEVPAAATKVDLKVGLYIPPAVRAYKIEEEERGVVSKYKFGEALSDGIERMFRNTFEDVVILDSPQYDAAVTGIEAVVVPEVASADFRSAAPSDKGGVSFLIRVKYEAKDAAGRSLWVDTFEGQGNMKAKITGSVNGEVMKRGLEDHFRKASSGLLESEWWKPLGRE